MHFQTQLLHVTGQIQAWQRQNACHRDPTAVAKKCSGRR